MVQIGVVFDYLLRRGTRGEEAGPATSVLPAVREEVVVEDGPLYGCLGLQGIVIPARRGILERHVDLLKLVAHVHQFFEGVEVVLGVHVGKIATVKQHNILSMQLFVRSSLSHVDQRNALTFGIVVNEILVRDQRIVHELILFIVH